MIGTRVIIMLGGLVLAGCVHAEPYRIGAFRLVGVALTSATYLGSPALRMIETGQPAATVRSLMDAPEPRPMAWLPLNFHNGTIEVDVAADLTADAPDYARGFVGVAFRIDRAGRHESIYLRPANATAGDQIRRNHTVQYAAYPGYDFEQLRKEAPERYETFADIGLHRWLHMRIVVRGAKAWLYLNKAANPAFIVRDMKMGESQAGGVGITAGPGSVVHFRGLRIEPDKVRADEQLAPRVESKD